MSIAWVQDSTEVTVTGTSSGNVSLTLTAGNFVCIGVMQTSSTARTYTAADGVNTYSTDAQQSATGGQVAAIIAALNVAAGATTITVTASGNFTGRLRGQEFSGVATSSALLDSSGNNEAATTTHVMAASGKVDTTGEALIVGCAAGTASLGTDTAGTGFTEIEGGATTIFYQWGIFATSQTDNQGAWTSTNSVACANAIAAYGAAAGASGSTATGNFFPGDNISARTTRIGSNFTF